MQSYSLFELNEYVRRIIALNFKEKLWVKGEISQISESKGHYYLSLVEKAEEGKMIIAESQAVIWARNYRRLQRKFKRELDVLLREGISVLLQIQVEYHERYGLKLIIEDIDPSYSLGVLELERRATINTLAELDLIELNRQLVLPSVLQKIALISSPQAAGLQDYVTQLEENPYGYYFQNHLFPASVQGINAEQEIANQVKKIALNPDRFDCLIIIRGGGARLDLKAFDSLTLSKAVAICPLPVLTGIGHDMNESIVDMVAHTALKTPTAVADFLIQNNVNFESQLNFIGEDLREFLQNKLKNDHLSLEQMSQLVHLKSENILTAQQRLLNFIEEEIPRQVKTNLKNEKLRLTHFEKMTKMLSPENILKRGFSITLKNGKIVQDIQQIQAGDRIQTILKDGTIESEVIEAVDEN